jgi:hypothetical protein
VVGVVSRLLKFRPSVAPVSIVAVSTTSLVWVPAVGSTEKTITLSAPRLRLVALMVSVLVRPSEP